MRRAKTDSRCTWVVMPNTATPDPQVVQNVSLGESPQISGPVKPSAAPSPAYAKTQSTHFGTSANAAAGRTQRAAPRTRLVGRHGIGGLVVTVAMAEPLHPVFQAFFVPTLGHKVE
jgi:hypothetical protein